VNPAQPLAGVRVLDLCVVFSGPFASMILADLGADVIKVESRQHYPDTTKGPRRFTAKAVSMLDNTLKGYVDADPGARPWNRSARVDVVSRNKRSMTVDLTRDSGREVFLDLVERADVVMENNAPGLLSKLRLEWDVLRARNRRLILLRMPALGLHGRAALSGVGSNFEAMVALPSFRGYPDLPARDQQYTFRMDASTGTGGALAVMAALRRARRTGEGREIVLSQTTNLMHQSADVLMAAQVTGKDPDHPGNGHVRLAPHGCYPTAVEDRWVVIACRDDDDWSRLVTALGEPAWAADAELATMEGRRRHEADLDEHIAAWTSEQTGAAVEDVLVAAGVPVSPVLREPDKIDHPQFVSRDWFLTMDHPEAGRRRYPGHMWRTTAGKLRADRPTTTLGQDNDDIYREVLGYDEERIEQLRREGHIGTRYEFEETDDPQDGASGGGAGG
jgi:crotonobetainyl-CoA:carnitine CoA-transferase CaiB-like acyl-CoA transferase